jgi:hypothetical protein
MHIAMEIEQEKYTTGYLLIIKCPKEIILKHKDSYPVYGLKTHNE